MNSIIGRFPIFVCITSYILLFSCDQHNEITDNYSMLIEKAATFNSKQEYDSAFFYFNKAKLECKSDEKERKIYALLSMASIQQQQNDFSGSEETVTEALKLDAKTMYLPNLYNQLGIAYIEFHDTTSAIKYYNKASNLTKDKLYKLILQNNLAVVYNESNQFQKAITILEPIVLNPILQQNPLEQARIIDNLGEAYFKKDSTKGIAQFEQALKIRQKEKAHFDMISSYFHLYQFYCKRDKKNAEKYAYLSYQKATMSNSIDNRLRALKYLIEISDSNQSKKYALQQIKLSDSIGIVRQKAKNQFAKIKYDAKIAIEETEKQKKQKITAFIVTGVLLTIGLLVFYFIRKKNRQKLKTVAYETETRISKQLHDELANDVYNLMTFTATQDLQNPHKKEMLIDNLDKIYSQTRNISKSNSEIETGEHFENYLYDMLSSYTSHQTNVIINKNASINWGSINKESKIAVYRVLQELMVNMKKHSQSSIVVIGFENFKNKIEINYTDNGVGCPEMLNFKKGLHNAENRIHAIKGTIIFETETHKGFKAKINIPK